MTTQRFTGAFETRVWNIDTGFLVTECFESHEDEIERLSGWTREGIVSSQEWSEPGIHRTKEEPPWWWGVSDQAEPGAPWIATGETFDEWWERVRPR